MLLAAANFLSRSRATAGKYCVSFFGGHFGAFRCWHLFKPLKSLVKEALLKNKVSSFEPIDSFIIKFERCCA